MPHKHLPKARFIALFLGLLLFISLLINTKATAQSDSSLRSELLTLRYRIDRLETEIRSVGNRGVNPSGPAGSKNPTNSPRRVNGELVGRSDPITERLATLVIELKERIKSLESRVDGLEKRSK
ncbi:MAG: hypothetical protein N5P05_000480 [Chroococcopsis gigantea SAG 12.99]|jgi:hypothetical protein|nr:hypothetical protein [Chlorogloea purpurea SAG 13.99]MDV2998874.1 hypothetical protein [Chroococcopsis gigantea SAG 12.99]